MSDITQILVNSSGAVVVAFMAFSFFAKQSKLNNDERQAYAKERETTVNRFTDTINGYMKESIQVKQQLAMNLQEFSDTSKEQRTALEKQTEIIDHLSEVIKRMYEELVKKRREKQTITIKN